MKGFQGTSLLDFPGRVASLVFTGGCNLTCPFCHNPGLVLDPGSFPDYPIDQLLADLQKRSSFIDGVVISGGEPTLDAGLPAFLRQLKQLGLQIKLDTNGLLPQVIEALLDEKLIDYLAIDIKTTPERYSELHTRPVSRDGLLRSIELAKTATIEAEFRTTCVPCLVSDAEIEQLGELLQGAHLWVLQQFVPEHSLEQEWQEFDSYPKEKLENFARTAEGFVERVLLRGI
nr:anaerobic ribonucleoside-triphosphate reductase activating protein [Malonomonas rubra]